jgi:hypothetical protein
MSELKPVGEFGSRAWGEACAGGAVKILQAADLPSGLEWGFTEHYTHPPARLLADGRKKAAYFIMVKDGEVTGGDGAPEECLALPGFHITARWAAICNQSGSLYGSEGQRKRSQDEGVMYKAITEYVGRPNPLGQGGGPKIVWPQEIGGPLMEGSEEGNGLHNIAATMQIPSPEFADLPVTEMGVPDFETMTDEQKKEFLKLLAVEL